MLFVFAFSTLCFANSCWAQENAIAKPTQMNFLYWLLKVSGAIGVLIFVLSIYFVAVAFQQSLELRMSVAAPPEVVEGATKLIEEKKPKELFLAEPTSRRRKPAKQNLALRTNKLIIYLVSQSAKKNWTIAKKN